MKHYGHENAKRSKGWTNNPHFQAIDKGKLPRSQQRTEKPLARVYQDANGKKRWVGTKHLKASQPSPYPA